MQSTVTNSIIIFSGRFQPFHLGHAYVYDHLCNKFGKDNVYLVSSNKVDKDGSPLNFKQKYELATKGFGIPSDRFIECKSPYKPKELLSRFNPQTTSVIFAIGEKDKNRFNHSNYFLPLTDDLYQLNTVDQNAYIHVTPTFASGRNATLIRSKFKSKIDNNKKKQFFIKIFGFFDQKLYDTLTR